MAGVLIVILSTYKNQKGQSAVEYVLLMLMVTSIMISLFSYLKRNYLVDLQTCQNINRQNLVCSIYNYVQGTGPGEKRFQYFNFKR